MAEARVLPMQRDALSRGTGVLDSWEALHIKDMSDLPFSAACLCAETNDAPTCLLPARYLGLKKPSVFSGLLFLLLCFCCAVCTVAPAVCFQVA